MQKIAIVLGFAVLVAGPARANDFQERLVRQLDRLGYTDIEISRTLLGRAQIIARNGDELREIILNPRTGEILRDYARGESGSPVIASPIVLSQPDPVAVAAAQANALFNGPLAADAQTGLPDPLATAGPTGFASGLEPEAVAEGTPVAVGANTGQPAGISDPVTDAITETTPAETEKPDLAGNSFGPPASNDPPADEPPAPEAPVQSSDDVSTSSGEDGAAP